MDPVSHLVMGRAVVAVFDRPTFARFGTGVSAAALIGALAPDIDCVLMPFGWDIYLRFHQAGTHSVLGATVLGGVVGLLLPARLAPKASGRARPLALALAATLAALTHLSLDVLSGAPLALGWPLVGTRMTLPLVAMADPWLVALFSAGGIAMWLARPHLWRVAAAVLIAVSLLFAVKATMFAHARLTIASDPRLQPEQSGAIEARWASWTEWDVSHRDPGALHVWRVSAVDATVLSLLTWPTQCETPAIRASRSLDTVRNFLSVHDFGFAVERSLEGGQSEVLWSDVRYCWQHQPEGIACAMWFGGVLDGQDRAIIQEVRLGARRQTRRP